MLLSLYHWLLLVVYSLLLDFRYFFSILSILELIYQCFLSKNKKISHYSTNDFLLAMTFLAILLSLQFFTSPALIINGGIWIKVSSYLPYSTRITPLQHLLFWQVLFDPVSGSKDYWELYWYFYKVDWHDPDLFKEPHQNHFCRGNFSFIVSTRVCTRP